MHICYLRDKYIVFARNCKFANSIQYKMQYMPCDYALLAQKTLFLSQESTFFVPSLPKSAYIATNLNIAKK